MSYGECCAGTLCQHHDKMVSFAHSCSCCKSYCHAICGTIDQDDNTLCFQCVPAVWTDGVVALSSTNPLSHEEFLFEEEEDEDSVFQVEEDAFENIMQQREAIENGIIIDAVDKESQVVDALDAIIIDKDTNLDQATIDAWKSPFVTGPDGKQYNKQKLVKAFNTPGAAGAMLLDVVVEAKSTDRTSRAMGKLRHNKPKSKEVLASYDVAKKLAAKATTASNNETADENLGSDQLVYGDAVVFLVSAKDDKKSQYSATKLVVGRAMTRPFHS
mmetsp:Transcript_7798/g.11303  ORF Transcript_7798/g.11303 Transcript_7798/m.11303 type:complete len:272 (+) Transcript_7798:148-963(+)